MKNLKNPKFIVGIVVIAIVAGCIGYMFGLSRNSAQNDYLNKLIDLAYPRRLEANSVNGTIKNIYGADVTLEINDPSDYLPHFDGTPLRKVTVTAEVSTDTKINSFDYSKSGKYGEPEITGVKLSDLKIGNSVKAISPTNIFGISKFSATEIDLIK